MKNSSATVLPTQRRAEPLLLLVILAVTLAAYSPALSFQFTYDDFPQIVYNRMVHSWQYAGMFLRVHVWAQTSNWGNYYRPMFVYLLLLEHTAFGLNPMGWHAVSIALHLAVVLLVFAAARELLPDRGKDQAALMSAMVFALHPIHIESVAWISGVTDPLMALFVLPCLLCFIRFRRQRKYRYLLLSVVFYAWALLSKETAIIVPGLIAAYELFFEKRDSATGKLHAIGSLLLFALVTFGYCIVRYRVLGAFSKVVTPMDWHIIAYTLPSVLLKYFRLLIVPCPLSLFYDVPYVIHPGWANFWLPCLMLALIAVALGYLAWRWGPVARFAIALLVLPILPPLNLSLLPLNEVVHDRYLYLSSIGLALLAGVAWQRIPASADLETSSQPEHRRVPWRAPLVVCIGFVLALLTAVQSLPWVNNLILYAENVKHAPNLPVVHNNMGNELTDRGMYDDAIAQYQIALKIFPNYWFSIFNLGVAYYKSGRYQEALPMFDQALHINGQDAETWYFAGLTQQKLSHFQEAEHDLGIAAQLWPSEEYRQALAQVQQQQKSQADKPQGEKP